MQSQQMPNLVGHVLASLPKLCPSETHEHLVLVCRHSPEGAMGVVLNQPLEGVSLVDLLEQIVDDDEDIARAVAALDNPLVYWGGPKNISRGTVIHDLGAVYPDTKALTEDYGFTPLFDILRALLAGQKAPSQAVLFLGYRSWGAGVLEQELKQQWLVVPCSQDVLFEGPADTRWQTVLSKSGLDYTRCAPYISVA